MTLVTSHPDRAPREPLFQADLTNKLRAWPADTWNKVGRPAGARPRGGGRWQRGGLLGPCGRWADRRGALALERPPMTSAAGGARADGRRPATACPGPAQGCDLSLVPPCTGLWQVSAADAGRPHSPSTLAAGSQAQQTPPSCPVPTDTQVPAAVGAASAGASNPQVCGHGNASVFHPAAGRPHLHLAPPTRQPESHHLRSSPEQEDPALGRTIHAVSHDQMRP